MDFTSGEMRQFVNAMRGEPKGGECVVRGTVTRVDADGTAWVQIGQNAEPTPCERDMACHVGDSVTVRIADHKATVTGNSTSPATDDHEAKEAHGVAVAAQASAEVAQGEAHGAQRTAASAATAARNAAQTADAASTAAGEAKTIAEATGQHVWDDESGLHVTETEREDYEQAPTGFARLMTSAGELLTRAVEGVEKLLRSDTASGTVYYDGECAPGAEDAEDHVVAAFTKDGAQIGRKGNAHVEMDFNSFKMVDKQGNEFFSADDLRDATGVASITETFAGNGSKKQFSVLFDPDEFVSATDSSHDGATYTTSGSLVTFSVAPSDGATVTIVYKTSSAEAKAYTLGVRKAGSVIGPLSVAESSNTTASGAYSHAEGYNTAAKGEKSHAEGSNTTANGGYSHAEGLYTTASYYASHAEGDRTTASGGMSHAEGSGTTASGSASHAEGSSTAANGNYSHAEGYMNTTANGTASHAEGWGTIANGTAQHVEGKFNVADTNNQYAHIIGNGTASFDRSNAYTVDWHGNVDAAGTITGASVGDANGTLQQLRDSVSHAKFNTDVEFDDPTNALLAIRFYAHDGKRYSFSVSTSGIGLWDYTNQRYIWQK